MAELTDSELAKVRSIINAFDGAQQISDLPAANLDTQDKVIEVYNTKVGASEKMSLDDAFNMTNHKYCGRWWNLDNATPTAAGWEGSLEMLRELPELLGLGCYLVQNDHSRRKLDARDHHKYANGAPAKLDGSEGHYQWGWGRKFYISAIVENRKLHLDVSLHPFDDGRPYYEIPVASMSATGCGVLDRITDTLVSYVNNDPKYRGGNNTSGWDDTYRSLLGMPATNRTSAQFLAAARKNGNGWLSGSGRHHFVSAFLFFVIFGTFNAQAAHNPNKDSDGLFQGGLGRGVADISDWNGYNGNNPIIPTSAGIELGDACGVSIYNVMNSDDSVRYAAPIPVFFGLKHPFGHIWKMMSDQYIRTNEDGSSTMMMVEEVFNNAWTYANEAGHRALSKMAATEGWISSMSFDNLELTPTATGGSETTKFCDYCWAGGSGSRLVMRGGGALHGSHDGLSAFSANDASSYAYARCGAPLCELSEEWSLLPRFAEVA